MIERNAHRLAVATLLRRARMGSSESRMKFEAAKTRLATYLRAMEPSGPSGFEGLLRDILVEVTGMRFGLAKSGPQGGSDVRSVGVNSVELALEAKRYKAGTRLPLDQLKAKLLETWQSEQGADVWILAATREITATDREELVRTGRDLGITALILDWPVSKNTLPDLAVLCSEAKSSLRQHLNHPDLEEIFEAIRSHDGYTAASSRVRTRLTQPDIGYASAVDAMVRWTVSGLENDRNAASRLGGKFHNLLSADRKLVGRRRYDPQLNGFLAGNAPAVLLGNEGMGKTWLFLSWWHGAVASGTNLPLTFFIPAKDMGDEPLIDQLARLLFERLGQGDQQFWRRRLGQWFQQEKATHRILVMIDGLNQHWMKRNWADLLQPAFDDENLGRFSILMSCWPDHWVDLQRLASLTPAVAEIDVDRFNDEELDALLGQHDLDRSKFSKGMQALMSVPRLSALAISRHADLADSGDITPERLAVEDWKHRIELRGAALTVSDLEFQAFVSQVGDELRASIDGTVLTRHGVLERLGRDSGRNRDSLQSTVSELIAGRWLEPTAQPHHFQVNAELVPFALGLSLAHRLRNVSEDAAANAIIADHIDPFRGQTLALSILRAAVTAALLDRMVLRPARRALLTRWLGEQNFSSWDFDAFWRLIGLDCPLVMGIIEDEWLGRAGSSLQDEIFIKALGNAHGFPVVATAIEAMVTRWLGWFWEDPIEGFVLGRVDLKTPDSIERQARTAGNLALWENHPARHGFPPAVLSSIGDASWLSHRVFGIISLLDRAPFIDAIAAWGISRAIMGMPRHLEELAWVLRNNDEDPQEAREAVDNLVNRLLNVGHPICTSAAYWLLEILADSTAIERLSELRPGHATRRAVWDSRIASETILDPAEQAGDVDLSAIEQVPFSVDINFNDGGSLVSLAKSDPARLRAWYGDIALSAGTLDVVGLRQLTQTQSMFMMVLTPEERHALLSAVEAAIRENQDPPLINPNAWQACRLELLLADLEGVDQLRVLLDQGLDLAVLDHVAQTMIDFEPPDLTDVLKDFPSEASRQIWWLGVFAATTDGKALGDWDELPRLLQSPDPHVRKHALRLASVSRNPDVLSVIATTDFGEAPDDRHERHYRSKCLLHASTVLGRPELRDQADKEVAAAWLIEDTESVEALGAYETYFRSALERLQTWRGSSFSPLFGEHAKPIGIMLDKGDPSLWTYVETWIDAITSIPNHELMDEFPMVALTRSLMTRRPDLGVKLWGKLMEAMEGGFVKLTGLQHFIFLAPANHPEAATARNDVLAQAVSDEQLFDLARLACEHGHVDWLASWIEEKATARPVGDTARAITILGFCDQAERFDRTWETLNSTIPNDGWLRHIYEDSRHTYGRGRWARHWYCCFLAATSAEDALASRMLLQAAMDGRATLWLDRKDITALPRWKRQHWDVNVSGLNQANKKFKERLKDKLFWTKIISKTQAPWI